MERYQSIKRVHAEPMTKGEYHQSQGLKLPVDVDSEGYMVVYNRFMSNQHISWCPKAEFEAGNVPYQDNEADNLVSFVKAVLGKPLSVMQEGLLRSLADAAGTVTHRPKGRMCAGCSSSSSDCSPKDFRGMKVIGKDDDGTCVVKCDDYEVKK